MAFVPHRLVSHACCFHGPAAARAAVVGGSIANYNIDPGKLLAALAADPIFV